ncbi:MAG TPA: hypothetical protein ENK18_23525 [Deltaproteobacteria bacterium]|nr:hypothetical protein [Deltaproteobacteria bacterium]
MRTLFITAVAALTLVTGCSKKAKYIDPAARSKVEGTGIEARDVQVVVAEMSEALIGALQITGSESPPRVAVMPVENRSRFLIDQEIFTTLITDELINNASGRIAIVNRDRLDDILAERQRKAQGQVSDDGHLQALAGVDWFLDGEIRSLSASSNKAQTDYVVIRFELTNAETGIVAWSNSYEMKKQGGWGVMYQ